MALAHRTALVTNVSTQLGYAVARRFGLAGAQIVVSDQDAKKTSDAVEGLQSLGVKVLGGVADIHSGDHRRALLELIENKFQRLDVVVLNADENTTKGDILESTKAEVEDMYQKYLTTPFRMCQQAYPLLSKSPNGSIIFTSSVAAYTPLVDLGLYSAAQTAVLGMVKALAISAGSHGIRVNSVVAGMMSGDGTGAVWSRSNEEIENQIKNMIPSGEWAKYRNAVGS
ncbi:hypothetical protein L596_007194 [Steinernema carpocapsae]|uniref:Uncharacterized protein n=1 Tax=Steinernema carpocapsae TaxID=34508 RepID=A0A4U5P8L2_STECR|nr:hypothetical protein L596_007194 [Steinernema carpocapsae]